jgi:hypothetical protein
MGRAFVDMLCSTERVVSNFECTGSGRCDECNENIPKEKLHSPLPNLRCSASAATLLCNGHSGPKAHFLLLVIERQVKGQRLKARRFAMPRTVRTVGRKGAAPCIRYCL